MKSVIKGLLIALQTQHHIRKCLRGCILVWLGELFESLTTWHGKLYGSLAAWSCFHMKSSGDFRMLSVLLWPTEQNYLHSTGIPAPLVLNCVCVCMRVFIFSTSSDAWCSLTSSGITSWLPSLIIYWIRHIDNSSFWQIVNTYTILHLLNSTLRHALDSDIVKYQDTWCLHFCDFPLPSLQMALESLGSVYLAFVTKSRNLHVRDRSVIQIFKLNPTHFLYFNLHLIIYFPLLLFNVYPIFKHLFIFVQHHKQ